ncbi:unnamed protein product [Bursaphelenchus xylophilus]|uniref:Glycine cleavage system H protein n=1 Tax=Bursaphelenchus xylophilus TaxID=6326 RepID=A0A1I7S7X2_BURXY|nr:unnamed protein product [Bursaphelenchus xylophilus]CAG9087179.1 unnamed protein product [Bursaphelenchus xylophilus]
MTSMVFSRFVRSLVRPTQVRQLSMTTGLFDRFYTKKHEYISVDGSKGTVGVSDFAQKSLGDVVYVELAEKGAQVEKGDTAGAIESVKSASDIYSPVSGTITDVNNALDEKPQLINKSPYDEGWLFKIDLKSPEELKDLMDEAAYSKFCEAEESEE